MGNCLFCYVLGSVKLDDILNEDIECVVVEIKYVNFDDLLVDIGFGNELSVIVVCCLLGESIIDLLDKKGNVVICGIEGLFVYYLCCCYLILDDEIVVVLSFGCGMIIY